MSCVFRSDSLRIETQVMVTVLWLLCLHVRTQPLVGIVMERAVAHVLVLPGKLRLLMDIYLGVQAIYYPRFTLVVVFFFSSRRRHTRCLSDWSSDVCSSDLGRALGREDQEPADAYEEARRHRGCPGLRRR